MKKMDNKAQGSQMLMLLMVMFLMLFIFGDQNISAWIATSLNSVFYPLIGFGGNFPVLTIILAGIFVVFLSSFFQNLFMDWKKQGEVQEIFKAFNKELSKAQKEGNTNRVNKLRKMQPQIMKKQTEMSGSQMKPMLFLFIFIVPIFIWLRYFLGNLSYYNFTTPWINGASLFESPIGFGSSWIWLYFIFSLVVGQVIRNGLKYITFSDWWKNIRGKNKNNRPISY